MVDTIRMAYLSHPLFLSCFVLDLNQLNITERDPAAFTHQKKKTNRQSEKAAKPALIKMQL